MENIDKILDFVHKTNPKMTKKEFRIAKKKG